MRTLLLLLPLLVTAARADEALVARLSSSDALARHDAARALGQKGVRAALPALIEALKDSEPSVRVAAGRAIVRIGARKDDIRGLVDRVEYGDLETAQLAGEALADLGAAAVPQIAKLLESDEARVRQYALAALTLCGRHAASVVPAIVDRMVDDDAATRQKASEAVRRCGPWAVDRVADLADRVEFGPAQVRWVAATVLASIGPAAKDAVPALQRMLEDDDKRLQQAAAHALKRIDIAPAEAERHPGLRDPARADAKAPDTYRVRFETTKGAFTVEVTRGWAPHGADRLYNLARIGFFDDTAFYRVMEGFVAQFGLNGDSRVNTVWKDSRIPDDPVRTSNVKGTVTFAMAGAETRSTQLFVNLGHNAALDGDGFAPVGRVVEGMKVVESLFAGYGDGPPRGQGPDQRGIVTMGNSYLKRNYPRLDWIRRAAVVGE